MKNIVIYHADCWDGFCAAWLFWKAFPDAEFHAAHYGSEPPDVTGKNVFIVDFSYTREVLRTLYGYSESLVVLDHHKTAAVDLEGFAPRYVHSKRGCPTIVFDMNKSGGRLAWEYLYQNKLLPKEMLSFPGYSLGKAPWLVDFTEDRDLWKWKLPSSKQINAALRSYPLNFAFWDQMEMWCPYPTLVSEGTAILQREKQIIDQHVFHAREIDMDGHRILSVNATVLFSEIAGELAKGRPFGACWFERQDGKRVWSLRSSGENGVDVSEIAKLHGGGGHKNAAGFAE